MTRSTLRRFLAAVLLAGAAANASATITFSAGYDGPWEWDEVTMTTRTEGSGMDTRIYYKGTACITGYNGSSTEIEIPSKIAWYHDVTGPDLSIHYEYEVEVVAIGRYAFSGKSSLISITIPDSVTNIGYSAFNNCAGLTSVTILGNVTNDWYSGACPFSSCPNIETLMLGSKMTKIGDHMFSGLSKIESITIPNGVTSIGNYTFEGCSGLTSITIPDSVTNIDSCAFASCTGLTSVTIPDSVESIGNTIFYFCKNVTEIRVPQSVMIKGLSSLFNFSYLTIQRLHLGANVSTIDANEFANCNALTSIDVAAGNESLWVSPTDGCLYDADRKTVFFCPRNATSVALPGGLEYISNYAFQNCSGLTEITIPEGVTTIGTYSFYNCANLASIVFPDSVTAIPSTALNGCTALWTTWYRTLGNLTAGGGGSGGETTRISFVATNVVLHYVASAVPSGAVTPPAAEGLVNVIAEVGVGRAIAVSSDWAAQYPGFENLYGTDFGAAIVAENGKTDGAGHPMFVWQDYVAGTDPTDPGSVFTASITFDATTGNPVIGWSPELSSAEAAKRNYKVFGKVRLNDADWIEVDGNTADYNFFKVRVEMK